MAYQIVTVIIPPEMSDHDDSYTEITEYVAACTRFSCVPGDPHSIDRISCEAFFEDDKGNIWHGQLDNPPYPDGSQKYVVRMARKKDEG